jgi:hypothetical protein
MLDPLSGILGAPQRLLPPSATAWAVSLITYCAFVPQWVSRTVRDMEQIRILGLL